MDHEFREGIVQGYFIRLEQGWATPQGWSGPLVLFRSVRDRCGILVQSKGGVWRCYFGMLRAGGYDQDWREEDRELVIRGYAESSAMIAEDLGIGP